MTDDSTNSKITQATEINIKQGKMPTQAWESLIAGGILFRAMSEQSGEGISLADTNGNYIYANPSFCQMTGYSASEIKEKNVRDFLPPEVELGLFSKVVKNRSVQRIAELLKKDGSCFIAEISGYPIRLEDQTFVLGIVRDITDRKNMEQAIEESEKNARALLDATTESVSLIDMDGTLVQLNETSAKKLGKTVEELRGKCVFDYFPPEIAKLRKEVIKNITFNKKPVRFQDERQGIIFDNNLYPIFDSKGNVVRIAVFARDITKEKQAEKTLRASEEKYKLLADNSTDVIYKIDLVTGKYTYISPSAEKLFGYTNEEFLDLRAEDLLTPLSYKQQRKILKSTLQREQIEPEILEAEAIDKEGRVIPIEVHARIISDQQGKPHEILGIARDITLRKKAELALSESENKFRSLVELTSDWIWEVDENGTYTYASPNVETLLGYQPTDLIGKTTPFDYMSADEVERVKSLFADIVATRQPFSGLENMNIHKDGQHVVLETSGVPFFDEAGNLKGYRGIDRDITERKLFTEKLQRSEERYKFLAENVADIVFTLDLGLDITYISPSIERVLGFSPEERKRQKLEEIFTRASLERVTTVFVEELEREKEPMVDPDRSVIIETENYHRNGSTVWMENIVKAIRNEKGHLIGIYGAARDISERKNAEQKLFQEKKKLEKAIAEIKRLSGLLPICASCKKIRDDQGYWYQIESYIREHSEADFSHAICPDCAQKLYPGYL